MSEQKEFNLARLAAYIDGEGCISIGLSKREYGRSNYYALHLTVANTDARLPLWCRENFGGPVRMITVGGKRKLNVFMWHVTAKKASEILGVCLPYFVIKKEQALIAIEFQKTKGHRGLPVSDEDYEARQSYREELQRLHREPIGHDKISME